MDISRKMINVERRKKVAMEIIEKVKNEMEEMFLKKKCFLLMKQLASNLFKTSEKQIVEKEEIVSAFITEMKELIIKK